MKTTKGSWEGGSSESCVSDSVAHVTSEIGGGKVALHLYSGVRDGGKASRLACLGSWSMKKPRLGSVFWSSGLGSHLLD